MKVWKYSMLVFPEKMKSFGNSFSFLTASTSTSSKFCLTSPKALLCAYLTKKDCFYRAAYHGDMRLSPWS